MASVWGVFSAISLLNERSNAREFDVIPRCLLGRLVNLLSLRHWTLEWEVYYIIQLPVIDLIAILDVVKRQFRPVSWREHAHEYASIKNTTNDLQINK
jgi:hypothetical protein